MPLEEYKDIIGSAAGAFTVVQCFSPSILCWNIIKRGSSNGVDIMPFLGGFVLSCLFLQNSLLLHDENMIRANILTLGLSIGYLTTYFFYSKEKVKFYIKIAKAFIFISVIISYAQRENPELVKFRFGLICTVIMFACVAAPLLSTGEILKTKNTDCLPMPLILSGTFVSFLWLLYGIAINETLIQIQNAVVLVLSVFQIVLYLHCQLQKSKKSIKTDKKKD